jgi:hypothetical protein
MSGKQHVVLLLLLVCTHSLHVLLAWWYGYVVEALIAAEVGLVDFVTRWMYVVYAKAKHNPHLCAHVYVYVYGVGRGFDSERQAARTCLLPYATT